MDKPMTDTATAAGTASGNAGLPAANPSRPTQPSRPGSWTGPYYPGYRLVLAKIAEDLGVSVVPVREAIRRLEAEGLVKFERNVGATVSGIDPTEYLYTMQTLSIVEGAATACPLRSSGSGRGPGPGRERRDARMPAALRPRPVHQAEPGLPQRPVRAPPTRTSWTSSTGAGTGSPPCGPPRLPLRPGRAHDSVDEHEALLKPHRNRRRRRRPSKKQPGSTAPPPWTPTSPRPPTRQRALPNPARARTRVSIE